jgi:hypothetical protein
METTFSRMLRLLPSCHVLVIFLFVAYSMWHYPLLVWYLLKLRSIKCKMAFRRTHGPSTNGARHPILPLYDTFEELSRAIELLDL